MGYLLDRRVPAVLLVSLISFTSSVSAAQDESVVGGRIAVTVKQNGAVVSSGFEVHRVATPTAPGAIVASGRSGLPVRVPAGTYDVVVRLDGAIDRPERWTRSLVVGSGRTVEVEASFETAILEVRAMSRGRRAAATIFVRRAGETVDIATLGAGVRAVVSAGTYDIIVKHRATERAFPGTELLVGRSRTLTVDFP